MSLTGFNLDEIDAFIKDEVMTETANFDLGDFNFEGEKVISSNYIVL
jgi:hypothetical protein